jgi:predicted SnoaL-like aldol condensation-catalyzing enzyme
MGFLSWTETLKYYEERQEGTKMKNRWSMAGLLILAGVLAVTVALSPSAALAKEYKFAGPPTFTVTYPGLWAQDGENPNKVLYRTKQDGSLPIMEIQCTDPKSIDGTTVITTANMVMEYKKRIEKNQQTQVTIASQNPMTLKDGTPAVEAVMTWLYQGFLNLQSSVVMTMKDGKWVYVVIHQNPGAPLWDAPKSLTFKK